MLFNEELDLCHSEGAERPKNPCRFFPFTEPVLSIMRFFAALRMTISEGFRFRITNGITMLIASTRYNIDNLKRQYITGVQNEYTYLALLPVVD